MADEAAGYEAQFESVRKLFRMPMVPGTNEHLERLQVELPAYFAGQLRAFSVPLVYPGSPFQQKVWEQLLLVPYGETRSYQELAAAVDNPAAVRAVGRANGLNRIAILIPRHRIVNKNGQLGGYGGGLRRKQYLLDLERRSFNPQPQVLKLRYFAFLFGRRPLFTVAWGETPGMGRITGLFG